VTHNTGRIPEAGSIPEAARLVLQRWRAMCPAGDMPQLHDFAPHKIPPALIPWSLTFRRAADRGLTYGIVGEELRFLFREGPRGKTVLYYASDAERAERYAVVHRALDTGKPVWYDGPVLFENCQIDFGRLGLPMRQEKAQALLTIYFALSALPSPRPHPSTYTGFGNLTGQPL